MGNRPAKAVSRRLLPRSAGPGAAAPGRVVSAEEVRRLQEKDEELVSQFREVTAELEEAEDERFRIVGSTEQRPLPKSRKVVEALEEEEIQKRSRLSGRVSPIGLVDILEQHRKGKDSTAIAAEFQRNTKEIQSIVSHVALPWIVIDKQNKRVEAFWEIPKDVEDAMKFFPDSFDKMLMGAYVKAKKQEEKIAKQEKEKLLKKEVK